MWKEIASIFRATARAWMDDKATRLAAALAYYTVFSLAPLLVMVIGIAGLLFDEVAAKHQIVAQLGALLGPEGAAFIQELIENASRGDRDLIATIVGFATLVLGATGAFVQLQDALNAIWEVAPKPNRGLAGILQTRALSFAMILVIGFLLLVSLVVSAALAALDNSIQMLLPAGEVLLRGISFTISFLLITFLFALIYKFLPDAQVRWRDVWAGAGVTSLLFSVGQYAIGLYLGNSSVSSAYGAAGSLAVLLFWIYYSAQILLFGAEFTQVYATRRGAQIQPAPYAVSVTDQVASTTGI